MCGAFQVLTSLQNDNLHSPKIGDIVYCIVARAIHCIRSEDSRIRPYAGHSVATRVYQIEVVAASIISLLDSYGLQEFTSWTPGSLDQENAPPGIA
jgi:hypothetical protein